MNLARLLLSLTLLPLMTACSSTNETTPVAVGDRVPAVSCPDENGHLVNLGQTASKGVALVYFYPKADTPGCTKQGCSLRDSLGELQRRGVAVYGVSMDTPAEQKAFKDKYALPFTLLADKDKVVTRAFQGGSIMASVGYAKRQAYLFRDGICVMADRSAPTAEQAGKVIQFLDTPAPRQ